MKFLNSVTPRRLAAQAVIAITVATATATGVAFAGRSSTAPAAPAAGAASASDPVANAARVALDRLVTDRTISQSQANTIEQYVSAGSIDPRALIADGLVSDGQMQAVAAVLDQVKRSVGH